MRQKSGWVQLLILGCAVAFPLKGKADTASTAETRTSSSSVPTDLSLFGGVSGGMGLISGQDYSSSPSGGLVQVNGLVSNETRHWTIDGGLGWMYNSVSGQNASANDIRIRVRAATAEFSPRYRLTERWQLGPAAEIIFGADTGYGPTVGNAIGTPFVGARAVYELPSQNSPLRFVAQALTDVGLQDRRVSFFTAGVQIGIPIRRHRSESFRPADDEIRATQAAPQSEPIRLILDPQQVFFGTNSSRLRPDVQNVLEEIGIYLSKNKESFSRVEISGHADHRGSFQYNLKLSRKRAESVRETLLSGGIDKRIQSEGYSWSQPVDPANNAAAWTKNRRVEVAFYDVHDPVALLRIIDRLPKGVSPTGVMPGVIR